MGLPCGRSARIKHGGRRILPANFVIPNRPSADQCAAVNDHLHAAGGCKCDINRHAGNTQERTLKLAGSGAMFEPIVLVQTSSVVGGLHPQ